MPEIVEEKDYKEDEGAQKRQTKRSNIYDICRSQNTVCYFGQRCII